MTNESERSFIDYADTQFSQADLRRIELEHDPAAQAILARTITIEDGQPALLHEDLVELEELAMSYGLDPSVAFQLAVEYWNRKANE